MNAAQILVRPLISEKSNDLRESAKQYTFLVHTKATKGEIRKAIAEVFSVNVTKIQTSIRPGKMKARNMKRVYGSKQKKAIVTLKEGQSIKMFEEQ